MPRQKPWTFTFPARADGYPAIESPRFQKPCGLVAEYRHALEGIAESGMARKASGVVLPREMDESERLYEACALSWG